MNTISALAGILLFASVVSDAFEVMLLPRRVRRQIMPVRLVFQVSWSCWSAIAVRIKLGKRRDGFLSLYGPLSMVLLLMLWALGLVVSFALIQWGIRQSPGESFLATLYFSGGSFFTVGYGDVLHLTHLGKGLAVLEAGTGLAFIAVTIGYLPVLYQLFSRREARIIQLDARAGSPPTAAALLSRHSESEAMDEVADLLKDWEQWCAEIVESH
ncbi:MAG: two pore domain potassium channel family protein, partial [Acidobacteriaceae bacterium]|nr:two pore domain potassium channel family protein [Acidobacteriaceae bacterium]